ncbi:MAG: bifunctional pyr operon transcriptional regulator/uracil phosphoribosyltransferase PyrR [Candidatus Dormibacteria bacterium]|jgi:pyrimidine operon attenuation protein/uracil phosphoribosyltransferase
MTQLERAAKPRALVLDGPGLGRVMSRLAHEIIERHPDDLERVVIAGVRGGGVAVALRLRDELRRIGGRDVPLVALDVSAFRDDRPRRPVLRTGPAQESWEPLDPAAASPERSVVILVDDVIQTGRTMRAAFDAVSSRGRPAAIEMAVLVDRGGREVPVRPNHVGKNLPVSDLDWVEIELTPDPADDGVYVVRRQ